MSKRKTHEQFIEELREVDQSIEVLDQYKTAITKMQVRCSVCGHLWETNPSSLLLGRGCPECGKKKIGNALRKSNADFVSELYAINPDIVPLEEYTGNRGKMLLHCNCCGNEWYANPMTILSGHGCPNCAGSMKKTNMQFKAELKQKLPNIESIDEYLSANKKIRVRCSICGYEWLVRPHDLLRSKGCPICRRNNREKHIK